VFKGFREFIMRGNVVDLAVAVVIGAAFTAVINAVVADILTPLIAAIGGKHDFSALYFTVHGSKFAYGDLINQIISFLIVAAVIYFAVVAPLNGLAERRATRLAAGAPADQPEAKPADILLLEQIRDALIAQSGGAGSAGSTGSTGAAGSTGTTTV
jgi:large conductance mechanosensitive channel